MSYSIEEVNGCTKKIKFDFEKFDISLDVNAMLQDKQMKSNFKGYRKGKAPLSMVKQLYGAQLQQEALQKFISTQFYDVIDKEELKLVGYPSFQNTKYEEEKSAISFEVLVEIFPKIDVKMIEGEQFGKKDATIEEEEIDRIRQSYLDSKATMVAVEDDNTKLETKHVAVFDFEGEKEDGEKPESMKAEEHTLEIGSGQFIPGFEDGMIGMKKGEEKDISVVFPEDYHEESLRNAPIKFHVKLLEIKTKKYPAFDDELIKEFKYKSIEDFEVKTRGYLEDQKERQAQEELNQKLIERLIELNEFDVPNALLHAQKDSLMNDIKQNFTRQGFKEDQAQEYFEKWNEDLDQKAEFQVRSGLLLDSIARKFEIDSDEEDLKNKYEEIARKTGMKVEEVSDQYGSNENVKKNLLYAIREEKTFDKIIENVEIVTK